MAIQYEIEVKSLLGSKENTNTLLKKLANTDEKFIDSIAKANLTIILLVVLLII